jgi:hypothetical protein
MAHLAPKQNTKQNTTQFKKNERLEPPPYRALEKNKNNHKNHHNAAKQNASIKQNNRRGTEPQNKTKTEQCHTESAKQIKNTCLAHFQNTDPWRPAFSF